MEIIKGINGKETLKKLLSRNKIESDETNKIVKDILFNVRT